MYLDDCIEGILRIVHSNIEEPVNLGTGEIITINGLVAMVEGIAGVELKHKHNLSAPKGVNCRNCDNALIKKYLGWGPGIRLPKGMERTYRWVHEQYVKAHRSEIVRT
jgi:GDP-D-mannose 3',5'-epimerase